MKIDNIHMEKLRSLFTDWHINDLEYIRLNGLTNKTYKIINHKQNKCVFLRIYTKLTPNIDTYILTKCSNNGFGPKILLFYPEGRIESWIHGRVLVHEDLNGDILKKIAAKLKDFHNIIGYNHNDLHLKNILLLDSGEIRFIDFEYCNKLDPLYDIANFFIEWMYVYENSDWYKPNINLLPTKNQMRIFCREYFEKYNVDIFIDKIISKFSDIHKYWIKWASNMDGKEYQLFKIYREIIKDKEDKTFFNTNIIYCDGVFDLLHSGHITFLNKIKKQFNCKKLIVGVISDLNVESYKRTPILNCKNRSQMLSNLRIVDKVIRDCPFNNITNEFLDYHGIDIVVYGGDPNIKNCLGKWEEHYKVVIDRNILKLVDYTNGFSTTNIINRCKHSDD